jgi:hypothetical protein
MYKIYKGTLGTIQIAEKMTKNYNIYINKSFFEQQCVAQKGKEHYENEKKWMGRLLEKAVQIQNISSYAYSGSDLHTDFCLLSNDGNCNGI